MNEVEIKLYNTATRKKDIFKPINEALVKFYSCGQTVYEDVHVGNAKTYVVWDVLFRTLKYFGYNVMHVQNFTDIGHLTDDADAGEDKITKKAKALKIDPMELVDSKIREYHENMDKINVHRPNIAPRATGHIVEMIDMISLLIEKDYAYELDGSVYFSIDKFEDYGKMAKLDLENLKAGARVDVISGKRNPGDFALWIKAPAEHIMKYTSPWSKGYPGWHLECSVMAQKYLGDTVDIHAGGIDHIPVHHTNEIAQSEGTTGVKFSNIWMHSAFITVNGEKMSKSKNNFYTLKELISELGVGASRMVLTQAHYRTQADFSMKQAKATKKRYLRMIRSYHLSLQTLLGQDLTFEENIVERVESQFKKALSDDLNTPLALTHVNTVVKRMDQNRKSGNIEILYSFTQLFKKMMEVLGIPVIELSDDEIIRVNSLVNLRISLKSDNKFEESDSIRSYLQNTGYVLQDVSASETDWFKEI